MKEGAQVRNKSRTVPVMAQVHQAVARFEPFAAICRKLFVLLEALREISFLYEFPAKTFMAILDFVLESNANSGDVEEAQRIGLLKTSLFREIAARVGRGLQIDDKIVFSILLARFARAMHSAAVASNW
jgi:hypothetical protein